jgi:mono/diheme cytochrome c family protein
MTVAIFGIGVALGAGYSEGLSRVAGHQAQTLAKALKQCRKDRSGSRRKACEIAARKKYASKNHGKKLQRKVSKGTEAGGGTTGSGGRTATGTGVGATTGTPTTGTGIGATTGAGATTGTGATTGATGTATTGPARIEEETKRKAEELQKAKEASNTPAAALVSAGRPLFSDHCVSCHGPLGNSKINFRELPLAQSVGGVMEQLIEPIGGMPNFDAAFTIQEKEDLGAYVCVALSKKCQEG